MRQHLLRWPGTVRASTAHRDLCLFVCLLIQMQAMAGRTKPRDHNRHRDDGTHEEADQRRPARTSPPARRSCKGGWAMLSPPKDGRAPNLTPRCPARTAVSSRSTTEPAARTRPAKLLQNAATATTTNDNGTPPANAEHLASSASQRAAPSDWDGAATATTRPHHHDAPNQSPIGSEPGEARPDTSALFQQPTTPPAPGPASTRRTRARRTRASAASTALLPSRAAPQRKQPSTSRQAAITPFAWPTQQRTIGTAAATGHAKPPGTNIRLPSGRPSNTPSACC